MADGDAAAAAGLDRVTTAQSRSQGARNHNVRGDELAKEIADRTTADNGKFDKNKVFFQDAAPANIAGSGYSGRFWLKKA